MRQKLTKKNIIKIVLLCLLTGGFIYFGTKNYQNFRKSENLSFAKEYNCVCDDNVFKYSHAKEVYEILQRKNGVIFMGFRNNKWSGPYAKILNDVAKEVGLKKILYYDFYLDRENDNGTYESIVNLLASYLKASDTGKIELQAPTLVVIKEGKIIGYDAETSYIESFYTPKTYWNEYNTNLKKATLKTMLLNYLKEE